jgi:hypothetical protein
MTKDAEESPAQLPEVPDIDQTNVPCAPESRLSIFMVETAALTKSTVMPDHDPRVYGESSSDWRPFPQQELPLTDYAEQVVGRLLVAEAERQYLRYRGQCRNRQKASSPSNTQPNPGHPLRPDGHVSAADSSASTPDRLGESPDA